MRASVQKQNFEIIFHHILTQNFKQTWVPRSLFCSEYEVLMRALYPFLGAGFQFLNDMHRRMIKDISILAELKQKPFRYHVISPMHNFKSFLSATAK